jgi:N-acetylglutamate synthase-like GNAT family acetyltransferase
VAAGRSAFGKNARVNARRGQYTISTDPARIDLAAVKRLLDTSYWAAGTPLETVRRCVENSLTFGVYDDSTLTPRQIGVARVITDRSTFAYLSDVIIDESHRGQGLSKWLVETILSHPDLQNLRRICLLTKDAQSLYARYGFKHLDDPAWYMELKGPRSPVD